MTKPLFAALLTLLLLPSAGLAATAPASRIVNGDFELGDTGFQSDYVSTHDIYSAGSYDVGTDPSHSHVAAMSYGDHTSKSGNMLVANGAVESGVSIWRQTVSVEPGTWYEFSGWVSTWVPAAPAKLAVVINGTLLKIVDAPLSAGVWSYWATPWQSGSNTNVVLSIVTLTTEAYGNDFSLDDLSLTTNIQPTTTTTTTTQPTTTYPIKDGFPDSCVGYGACSAASGLCGACAPDGSGYPVAACNADGCGECGSSPFCACPTGTVSRCCGYGTCGDPYCCVPLVLVCGDGFPEGTETCDDNNATGGDGCSAGCTIEQGWQCSDQPSVCVLTGGPTTTTTTTQPTTTTTVPTLTPGNPPTARFTTSGIVGFVGLPLGFDAFYSTDPENSLVAYDWDFGDGSPHGHAQAMSRAYAVAGTYDVRLTVTDAEGLSDASGRQIQVLSADQIGLFNAYVNYSTTFDRSRIAADKLGLYARLNIGDAVVAPGDTVALEIAGQRFSAVLDQNLRAAVAGMPSQKWQLSFGLRTLTYGEVNVRLKVKKADLGLGFNLLGALPGGDMAASLDVPVKLEIGSQSFLVAVPTDFLFSGTGISARGYGASE